VATVPAVAGPFTVIVNPAAGRGRTAKVLPRLAPALADAGLDAEVLVSTGPDDPARMAAEAIDRGRVPVACGGDGLVSMVAGVVADHGALMGIVPTGAGNDFARHLGLDHKDPLAAVPVLASGVETTVDLARVGGRWVCCVVSAGFDAEANRWANGVERLSGTPLYVAATLRTLGSYRPRRFEVTVDGEASEVEAWLVAVANTPNYAGGMRVAPAARTDDGVLHVTVVGPVSRGTFLRTFPKVFSGRHVEHPLVDVLSGRSVTVTPLDGPGPAYADGEPLGDLPVTVEAVPDALRVLAPASP
jgi:diacylglycerol kinase (ATP)